MTKEEWYQQLFSRLEQSKFRSSFHLKEKDKAYIREKGMDTIRRHAEDFIAKRSTCSDPQRRKADADAGTPGIHSTTCNRDMLQGMHI